MLEGEVNTRKLDMALRLVPKELKFQMGDVLDHISRKFLKIWRKERLQGPPGIKAHSRGIFTRFKRAFLAASGIEGMGVEIFTESKIARAHETGITLRAPAGQHIAIPFSQKYRPEMYTARGKLRLRYRFLERVKGLFEISARGKQLLVKRKRGREDITPMYVLKQEVELKPRLGFYSVWDSMENENIRIINRGIEKALRTV